MDSPEYNEGDWHFMGGAHSTVNVNVIQGEENIFLVTCVTRPFKLNIVYKKQWQRMVW